MHAPHNFAADPTLVFPDYQGRSLLNLMQTLRSGLDLPDLGYAPLAPETGLSSAQIAGAKRVLTIVIDGMGDQLLATHAPDGLLRQYRRSRLTSVFPSTTASAIPTFFTGLPPQAHGLTGWHMWLREIGQTLSILPLSPRDRSIEPIDPGALPSLLFQHAPISAQLPGRVFMVAPNDILESPFNQFHSAAAARIGYHGLHGFVDAIEQAVQASANCPAPVWIHAYYPALDSLMHQVGTQAPKVADRIRQIDAAFGSLLQRLHGSSTLIIVTADHGFIDAPDDHLIELDHHPALAALLARPLCGERRLAFAYVAQENRPAFVDYLRTHFADACRCVPTADFIAEGWFGPGPAHPELASRCGDFVLQMRGDWTIKDWLQDEPRYRQPGVHAGASADEMFIPLIVAQT